MITIDEKEDSERDPEDVEDVEGFLDKVADEIQEFDLEIVKEIQTWRTAFWNDFWKIFTAFGRPYFWILLGALLALFRIFHVGIVLLIGGISYFLLIFPFKIFYRRKRPHHTDGEIKALIKVKQYSFPSGHTYLASIMAISLCFCYGNIFLIIISLIFGLLVGFSRIYLGVHYLTDVLSAFAIAVFISFLICLNMGIIMDLHYMLNSFFFFF